MNYSGTFLSSRNPVEVFDLLATPERFAPLLPDYDSMTPQDATHFTLRIAIALGEMSGHVDLAMELAEAERPTAVGYRGQGMVAGSQLRMSLLFGTAPVTLGTEVSWQGEFSLDGALAFLAGSLVEPMGHKHFDRMAERLRNALNPPGPTPDTQSTDGNSQ
jgi:carbon monoxide dehydrogenase subunit G